MLSKYFFLIYIDENVTCYHLYTGKPGVEKAHAGFDEGDAEWGIYTLDVNYSVEQSTSIFSVSVEKTT